MYAVGKKEEWSAALISDYHGHLLDELNDESKTFFSKGA